MKRGTIQSYDPQKHTGVITPDDGSRQISFRYPQSTDLALFDEGDRVEFEVEGRKAINVQIYERVNVLKDIFRDPRCRCYRRYIEAELHILDGDWGDYIEMHCRVCGALMTGYGRLGDAYWQYKDGTMPEEEAAEFAKALEDRRLMSDFLLRKFKFH